MVLGMTGFAERSFTSPLLRVKIGIKTLNHRSFDWTCKGSPLGPVESRLRELCRRKISRGRVEVHVEWSSLDPRSWEFRLNEGLLERIVSSLDRVSRRTGRPFEISLDGLVHVPQLVEIRRKGLTRDEGRFLERCFLRTMEDVLRMRRREGLQTGRLIRGHLSRIRRSVARLENHFKRQPARLRAKLERRLRGLDGGSSVPEDRLAGEASLMAQRYDLAEEIGRLRSHLDSLEALLSPRRAGPAGKPIDFLSQEINREANTVASKSQDIGITKETLLIKNELESIRQHVQNLE